jgi:hypothetical protein
MHKFLIEDYPNEYPEIEVGFEHDANNELVYTYRIREHLSYIAKEEPNSRWYNRVFIKHTATGFKSLGDAYEAAMKWMEEGGDYESPN